MKVLVSGFSSPLHCEIIRRLSERSFDVVYWVAKKRVKKFLSENTDQFQHAIFHDYIDALAGIAASNMNTEGFEPVDTRILDALVAYEPQLLSLMSRIDFGDITFLEKQHRYYEYVWYWHGVLSLLKPDIVIFHDVPHIVFDTVLYYIAKTLGIKTVLLRPLTSMRDHVAFFEDFHDYKEVRKEYERLKKIILHTADITPDVYGIYNGLKILKAGNIPHTYAAYSGLSGKEKAVNIFPKYSQIVQNIKQLRFFTTTKNYVRLLFRRRELCSITKRAPRGFVLLWNNIRYKKLRQSFKKEYESLHNEHPNFSQPYVYFPLHSQPEATTNPMGGVFHDQILAADMLAKALPKGWKLYIKEHADQWALPRVHTGRYPGYYKMLSRHKNVELISVSISGFDLIQNAKATATIGGSTAMESVVKGKPVFVFGYAMYGECDGMFHINTFESCQRAMKVIEEGYMPDQLNVLRFFQALKNVSVGAYIHKRHEQGSKYSYEESIKNMTEGLYNACRT